MKKKKETMEEALSPLSWGIAGATLPFAVVNPPLIPVELGFIYATQPSVRKLVDKKIKQLKKMV